MKIKDTLLEIQEQNAELQTQIDFLQQENSRLLKEHRDLTEENSFYKRQVNGSRFRIADLRKELDRVTSLGMWEFADEFCSEDQLEEDGRLFARELLRTRVTGEYKDNETAARIAEEEFISNGEALYESTWNINCGDDF